MIEKVTIARDHTATRHIQLITCLVGDQRKKAEEELMEEMAVQGTVLEEMVVEYSLLTSATPSPGRKSRIS